MEAASKDVFSVHNDQFLQCIICNCSCTILNDSSTRVSSLFGAILKLWIVEFLIGLVTVFLIFKSICMHKASAKWMHANVRVWCDVLTCISHLLVQMLRINPGYAQISKIWIKEWITHNPHISWVFLLSSWVLLLRLSNEKASLLFNCSNLKACLYKSKLYLTMPGSRMEIRLNIFQLHCEPGVQRDFNDKFFHAVAHLCASYFNHTW